jgi:hypothetical protein
MFIQSFHLAARFVVAILQFGELPFPVPIDPITQGSLSNSPTFAVGRRESLRQNLLAQARLFRTIQFVVQKWCYDVKSELSPRFPMFFVHLLTL